jgi:hypothetical protein
MAQEPYRKMQQAAWAAFRKEPDPDGIRRVAVVAKGTRRPALFCLTEAGDWFLADDDPAEPQTPLRACPVDWVPPEFRETRAAAEGRE